MRAPDITYRYIYPKDTAGPTFELVSRDLQEAASANNIDIRFAGIPKDKVLVLSNVAMNAVPGGALVVTNMQLSAFTQQGQEFIIAETNPDTSAVRLANINWQGAIYIPGRAADADNVRFLVFFDAGTSSNALRVGLHGVVIPRGNVSSF